MKQPLTKSVSMSEMLEYRIQGLSNSEIAEILGVARNTVYQYLGKNPDGIRKPRTAKAKERRKPFVLNEPVEELLEEPSDNLFNEPVVQAEEPVIVPEEPKAEELSEGLKVVSKQIHAESASARYTIDCQLGTVKVAYKNARTFETYTKKQLEAYVEELLAVLQEMEV